jgi:hypothetical protein
MKTPKCKECKGTGTVHIDIPHAIFQNGLLKTFDLTCWTCGGANFKGMTREQISWYLKASKALETIKLKSLREGELIAPASWSTLKNAINMACTRLKISAQSVAYPKATQYGETNAFLHLKAEFAEFGQRLESIPGVLAGKVVA